MKRKESPDFLPFIIAFYVTLLVITKGIYNYLRIFRVREYYTLNIYLQMEADESFLKV